MTDIEIPDGLVMARTTPLFDERTVPAGLLRAHQIAEGVWGRLVVKSGSLEFAFEDQATTVTVEAGDDVAIPPQRPHHVVVGPAVSFVVEFYRSP